MTEVVRWKCVRLPASDRVFEESSEIESALGSNGLYVDNRLVVDVTSFGHNPDKFSVISALSARLSCLNISTTRTHTHIFCTSFMLFGSCKRNSFMGNGHGNWNRCRWLHYQTMHFDTNTRPVETYSKANIFKSKYRRNCGAIANAILVERPVADNARS